MLIDRQTLGRKMKVSRPEIYSVASGKGGVGKTLTTIHLALSWQNQGNDVLIIDGDLGLANVDIMLGLHARRSIYDVIEGSHEMTDIALDGPFGVKILPSGSGIAALSELSKVQRHLLSTKLRDYIEGFDIVIIDNGAGINSNVKDFSSLAKRSIVVTTPEPHAITDAYALIKVLSETDCKKDFRLLVNMAQTPREAQNVFDRLSGVSRQFLGVCVSYLGHIPSDPQLSAAIRGDHIGTGRSIRTLAGQSWGKISYELSKEHTCKMEANSYENDHAENGYRENGVPEAVLAGSLQKPLLGYSDDTSRQSFEMGQNYGYRAQTSKRVGFGSMPSNMPVKTQRNMQRKP